TPWTSRLLGTMERNRLEMYCEIIRLQTLQNESFNMLQEMETLRAQMDKFQEDLVHMKTLRNQRDQLHHELAILKKKTKTNKFDFYRFIRRIRKKSHIKNAVTLCNNSKFFSP